MKAHIPPNPRCALLWRFGPGDAGYETLARTARLYRLTLRCVAQDELNTTVGDLCDGKAAVAAAPAPTAPALPALIISGLRHDNGELNDFLDAVRQGGADIALRAMVTPTSRSWPLAQLLVELAAERAAVEAPI